MTAQHGEQAERAPAGGEEVLRRAAAGDVPLQPVGRELRRRQGRHALLLEQAAVREVGAVLEQRHEHVLGPEVVDHPRAEVAAVGGHGPRGRVQHRWVRSHLAGSGATPWAPGHRSLEPAGSSAGAARRTSPPTSPSAARRDSVADPSHRPPQGDEDDEVAAPASAARASQSAGARHVRAGRTPGAGLPGCRPAHEQRRGRPHQAERDADHQPDDQVPGEGEKRHGVGGRAGHDRDQPESELGAEAEAVDPAAIARQPGDVDLTLPDRKCLPPMPRSSASATSRTAASGSSSQGRPPRSGSRTPRARRAGRGRDRRSTERSTT